MLSSHTVGFQRPDNSNLANLTPAKFQDTGSSHVDHKDVDLMSTKYVVYETEVRSKEHRDRVGTCLYQKCQKKLMIRK